MIKLLYLLINASYLVTYFSNHGNLIVTLTFANLIFKDLEIQKYSEFFEDKSHVFFACLIL